MKNTDFETDRLEHEIHLYYLYMYNNIGTNN